MRGSDNKYNPPQINFFSAGQPEVTEEIPTSEAILHPVIFNEDSEWQWLPILRKPASVIFEYINT